MFSFSCYEFPSFYDLQVVDEASFKLSFMIDQLILIFLEIDLYFPLRSAFELCLKFVRKPRTPTDEKKVLISNL